MNQYVRGQEDIPLTITMSESGADKTEVTIVVKHKKLGTTIGTYTLTGGTVTVVTTAASFIVGRSETDSQPTGVYVAQVTTKETNANYESNIKQESFQVDLFYLKSEL